MYAKMDVHEALGSTKELVYFSLRGTLHGGSSFWLSWLCLRDNDDTPHELGAAVLRT